MSGRPSTYTEEMGTKICTLLANGLSLRKIGKMEDMPEGSTVWKWLKDFPAFAEQYTRAREDQAEYYADEMVTIADGATDNNSAACARLQVDTRKWVAAKLRPKKYGELVKHEHGGPDGGSIPISITVNYVDSKERTG